MSESTVDNVQYQHLCVYRFILVRTLIEYRINCPGLLHANWMKTRKEKHRQQQQKHTQKKTISFYIDRKATAASAATATTRRRRQVKMLRRFM